MDIAAKFKETLPKTQEAWPKIKKALPATIRVARQTTPFKNRRIWEGIEKRIHYFADHPEEIDSRLTELDREWDVERVLKAFAAMTVMGGVGLSLRDKRFLTIPGLVSVTLLQHAIQGWSPPLPLLRRLGVRTQTEIQVERNSLKALKEAFAKMEHRPETAMAEVV